eukprot:6182219-Pleurochrysis_carterae.AAC.3
MLIFSLLSILRKPIDFPRIGLVLGFCNILWHIPHAGSRSIVHAFTDHQCSIAILCSSYSNGNGILTCPSTSLGTGHHVSQCLYLASRRGRRPHAHHPLLRGSGRRRP